MKRTKAFVTKIDPELNQSENSPRSKKSKKDHSMGQRIGNKGKISIAESFIQDIVESSQPSVISKRKSRMVNYSFKRRIVKSLTTELFELASSGEPRFKELSFNSPESCVGLGGKSSRDYRNKSVGKKDRKKRRIPFIVDDGRHFNQDYDIVKNEKPNFQIHVELNHINHDGDGQRSESKVKQTSTSFSEFLSPDERQHTDDAETELGLWKKDRKRKGKERVEKKITNTLLAMIYDNTSSSDAESVKNNDCCIPTLNKRNTRKHNKSRVSQISSTSIEKEESHSSRGKHVKKSIPNPKGNKTLDNHQSKDQENEKDSFQNNHQGLEFVQAITSKKLPADTASNCSLLNILIENVKTEPNVIKKYRKHETRERVKKKKANTLLAMIHDSSSSSDSDDETQKIDDCSVETLNKENSGGHNRYRASKIFLTSSEDEGSHSSNTQRVRKFISSSRSNKTSDNHRPEGREGDKEFSQDSEQDFEFVGAMKSAKFLADTASNCRSPNISVERVKTEPDLIGKHKKHRAKEKVEKKKADTLLAIIHDNSSNSDSDNETKKIDDCSVETLNKGSTRKHNKSEISKMLATSSDEDEESYSYKTKYVGKFDPNLRNDKTLDNQRSESLENDRDCYQDDQQDLVFVKAIKSEELPVDAALNCSSPNILVEDIKIEPDVIGKDKKHKAKKEIEKKKVRTLLTMIHDRGSSSDSNDEIKKIDDSSEESVDEVNSRKITKSGITETSNEEERDEAPSEQHVKKPSAMSRKFDLEEGAKDIEELIRAMEEEEQIPDETVERLLKLRVRLKHTVPPQHQIETRAGSRGPTPMQKKIIEKFGPIKYGKFAPEENEIIVNNWKSFCELHDWDPADVKPFLCMRHQNIGLVAKFSERLKFVQFLADGLPWRTLYSVYCRFRNLYQPNIQTKYTDDEDKLIIAHMENSSAINEKNVRKFVELGKILNRTRASVWRRYRLLKKTSNPHKKLEWNLHLVKEVIKNLMQLTLCKDVCQLKDLDIPLVVWKKLSKKLKIDNNKLKQFWQKKLHIQLFCQEPVYMNDVKIKLMEYFHATGISKSSEIKWRNVAKHFDGMTPAFLYQIFAHLVCNNKYKGMEFREIIEYLYKVKKPELQKARKDKCLPRVVFKDGNVELLDVKANDGSEQRTVKNEDLSD